MKKTILTIMTFLVGLAVGFQAAIKNSAKSGRKIQESLDKYQTLFLMMKQWLYLKQKGYHLESYFKENGYKQIAVYGMGYAGHALVDELMNSEVKIAYGIDRNMNQIYGEIDLISLDDNLPEVDAIVVTAVTYFEQVEESLQKKLDCPILSLENILYMIG